MKTIRVISTLLAGLIVFLIACNPTGKTGTVAPSITLSPSPLINVELSISKLPILNETVDLTCRVSSLRDAPNSTAQIKLSKGVSLVSGNLQWQGDLKANASITFLSRIMFNQTGHQTIEATAGYIIDDKNSWGDIDAIYLDIGSVSSTFGWPITPAPLVRTDKWGVIKTDLEISHAPKLNEPAKLFITTVSPVDFAVLNLGILIQPKTALLTDSDLELTAAQLVPGANQYSMKVIGVDLNANIPHHFSVTVVFKEAGYYSITADAQQKVDNVTYHGTQDTIYLKIGAGGSSFEQEPPRQTTPGTIPPIPPVTHT